MLEPSAIAELAVGRGQSELGEEHRRELVVEVLAGVDEHLLVLLAQLRRDRRRLDELRAVADHREDLHGRPSSDADARLDRRAAGAAVTGPGAAKLVLIDRGHRLDLARRRGQEHLVGRRQRPPACRLAPSAPVTSITSARVIEARMCSSSGGVRISSVLDPEDRAGRRLEHAAVGRDQQRLVEAVLAGQPAGQHVGRVGERLDAVEDARRRVGDRRQPDPLGAARAAARSAAAAARRA